VQNLKRIIDAASQLRESEKLAKFLMVCAATARIRFSGNACALLMYAMLNARSQVTLALGNFVNGGSFRANAYGFKLDGLLKVMPW